MRILHLDLCSAFPLARAGGHRTIDGLLRALNARSDTECLCVFPRRGQGSQLPEYDPRLDDFASLGIASMRLGPGRWEFDCGYPAWAFENLEPGNVASVIDACIDRFAPDLVWSNSFRSLPVLEAARQRGLASFWYVQDGRPEQHHLRSAAEMGVQFAAVSDFIAGRVARLAEAPCQTIYPLIKESDYLVSGASADTEYVTFINPRPVKGFEIFLRIPALLPEVRFLVVEAWPLGKDLPDVIACLGDLPNVRFLRQQSDMRPIYAQTRLLLVPSVVEEGGPRVIREAQLNGIPVLGSPRGGVPEMVGQGGLIVADFENPASWARTIAGLLEDRGNMEKLAHRARNNAQREELQTSHIADAFHAALLAAASAGLGSDPSEVGFQPAESV